MDHHIHWTEGPDPDLEEWKDPISGIINYIPEQIGNQQGLDKSLLGLVDEEPLKRLELFILELLNMEIVS